MGLAQRQRVAFTAAIFIGVALCAASPVMRVVEEHTSTNDHQLTVLCTTLEDWCHAMSEAFQRRTGIRTSYVRLAAGEALARLRATRDNPEYSVWWGSPADTLIAAGLEGLLEAYRSPNAAAIPPAYKDPEGWWTGVFVGTLGFCANTEVLSRLGLEQPDSWNDLLDHRLRGEVAMAHPASSGAAYTALWTQVARLGSVDAAFAYLHALHRNILQYTRSGPAPGLMAGRGEIAVAVIFAHDCLKFAEEGMPALAVSFPREGTGYAVGGVALIKGAPERDAAKRWIDWALTPEAQEIGPLVKAYPLPTHPRAKRPAQAVRPGTVKLVDYDLWEAGRQRRELSRRFEDEVSIAPQ
jgi:iron(III) transport system substrate-binding protein